MIKKLLEKDPKLRPEASEALTHPWFHDEHLEHHLNSHLEEEVVDLSEFELNEKLPSEMIDILT